MKTPAWKAQLAQNGWADAYLAGDAFKAYIESETVRITDILTQLGLVK